MSDTEIQAAWRRWRAEPSADNALAWARLKNRTEVLGPSVADAFGLKDAWGKRAVRVVSKAMVLLHGTNPPRLAELPLTEVARLSRKQWRDLGECGPVTLGEIRAGLEANGLAISETDDEIVGARLSANALERAVNAANTAALTEEMVEAQEELDDLLDSLVAVRNERDVLRRDRDATVAALSAVRAELDALKAAVARTKDRIRGAVEQVAIGGSPSLSKAVSDRMIQHATRQAVGACLTKSGARRARV